MASQQMLAYRAPPLAAAVVLLVGLSGCSPAVEPPAPAKPPRPVSTLTLTQTRPGVTAEVAGSVVSWKTEQIGFEVGGRVRRVIEPNETVEGRVVANHHKGKLLSPGTPLAELDDERFQIAVQSARAGIEIIRRQIEAVQIDIAQRLPAEISAAEAERQRAELDLGRHRALVAKSATTQSQLDQAEAAMATTEANLARSKAELASRQAELRSLEAQALQAEQRLADEQRNLENTVLYSSFPGQVAATHIAPGSYVQPGDPAVTVQLMDPVLIEFELSAEASRGFQHGDSLRVRTIDQNKQPHELYASVYMTDAAADPQTRTFTVRLFARNQRMQMAPPPGFEGKQIARTTDLLPLNLGPVLSGSEQLFAEEESIHHDDEGAFLWKAVNRRLGEVAHGNNRLLEVEKLRIDAGSVSVPFLGNWNFTPVSVRSDQDFDPERDLIAGKLIVEEGDADSWNGKWMLYDRGGWLLRPGELVQVELSAHASAPGFYVPMNAIRHESGKTYVFVIDAAASDQPLARRVDVSVAPADAVLSSQAPLERIEPLQPDALVAGMQLVMRGAHYLTDGDAVVVINKSRAER